MLLFDTRTGVVVRYKPNVAFRYRMMYTADRGKYLCLEPQISVTNAPSDKEYTHIPMLRQGRIPIRNIAVHDGKGGCVIFVNSQSYFENLLMRNIYKK